MQRFWHMGMYNWINVHRNMVLIYFYLSSVKQVQEKRLVWVLVWKVQ
jgi:hypothetical protein